MDEDTAARFVSSLVKSIQALCNGYVDFSSSIEVIGHIHLNIDRNKKLDYVLTEEVSKSLSEGSTVFASHSYHSHAPQSASSKSKSDSENQNRRKNNESNDNDQTNNSRISGQSNASRHDSHNTSRLEENSDSSQSGKAHFTQDHTSMKLEAGRTSCQVQENIERRRKSAPLSHSQRNHSPAAKRSRPNDSSSNSAVQNPSFDVIEIKEEPDDEPSVYFGDPASSSLGSGQDIQTPDFSNVVMESLDRVGQIEGSQLMSSDGGNDRLQHQPFPVMLHSGQPSTSSQVPGPSLDPRPSPSTSGELSEAEYNLIMKRQRNAMHARNYRQRARQSAEKLQKLRASAKVRQKRYLERQKEKMMSYCDGQSVEETESGHGASLPLSSPYGEGSHETSLNLPRNTPDSMQMPFSQFMFSPRTRVEQAFQNRSFKQEF